MTTIFIGLGSNISPEENLRKAATMLRAEFPGIRFSSVYRSKAREVEDQDDFLNAVARAETEKSPEEVHAAMQSIEESLGKAPPYRFGPRTIDLDLLLYDNSQFLNSSRSGPEGPSGPRAAIPQLIIPHPRMHERRFVLEPLCELIDAQSLHPVLRQSWDVLLKKNLDQQCARTAIAL